MLDDKCRGYRAAGTRLIWVVDPVRRGVQVHHESHATEWVPESGGTQPAHQSAPCCPLHRPDCDPHCERVVEYALVE